MLYIQLYGIFSLTEFHGNSDKHLLELSKARKCKFLTSTGEVAAYIVEGSPVPTIRSQLVISGNDKCSNCVRCRNSLRTMYNRWIKQQKLSPSQLRAHTVEMAEYTTEEILKSRMRASDKRSCFLKECQLRRNSWWFPTCRSKWAI